MPRPRRLEAQTSERRTNMKISNKYNDHCREPVAIPLPFVASKLPSGCPPAAGMLPTSCLQFADALP
jgi:hypothetical protein